MFIVALSLKARTLETKQTWRVVDNGTEFSKVDALMWEDLQDTLLGENKQTKTTVYKL